MFCGTKFEEAKLLFDSIESKGASLKLLLSKDEQQIHQLQDNFVKNRINVILDVFKMFITSLEIPSKEHLEKLRASTIDIPRFEKLRGWLLEEKIKFSDLLLEFNAKYFDLNQVVKNTHELQHRIIQKISPSSESYEENNTNFNFDNTFAIYFESKTMYIERSSIVNVDQKIAFIDNLYIDSISTDLKVFKKVSIEISMLEEKQIAVKRLIKNLNTAISRYQKLLIKDIEVPFYIYSGKVLQAHQSGIGNGIFIKDKTGGDTLKNIRFVSNWDSDHDVLNTMSSGQIAAIVITLYLALNKVYAQGFGCLLIDDPVQTMDEINMISLVELLRNEFSDSQIILSTHEDHVSKYFLYKFLKYHLSVRQIKLIDRKEFQLSNPRSRPLVSA
ncbi:hypothetical protein [Colwellia sp. TT2012]|uniref:hypothetical protein n=1 Tax=Colwellia sp. TT2012 TaxID=1720342 RepID=UPI000708CE86|nr:hypothetical protein [Colwellia sp. TT2012]